MRRAIRAAVSEGYATVAVVCGAWHVPALDIAATSAATDNATLRGLRKVKVGVSWVPWTHRRLAAATGYGAGVRHPGWYDHVFRHPGPDGVTRFFVDAAHLLRGAGMAASPDHLIAASRMAETLSVLRGRPRPGLDEVLDSADAVMGGLPLVRRRLVVGEAIGEVPPGAPQVPLARDLLVRQRRVRLKPTFRRHRGRARPAHAERSGEVAPPAPARRPRRRMGCARGGARHEWDVPRDVAGRVGAGDVGAPRRARRARHHRRAGGDEPARRAGDERRRAPRARRPPSIWRCSPICRSRSGRSSSSSRRGPPTIPTSAS